MDSRLLWCASVVFLCAASASSEVSPKSKDHYDVRPSSQTIKHRQAAQALAQAKDAAQAGPQLLEALNDKDAMTRAVAIESISTLKYGPARPKLAELLTTDPNAQVRVAAAAALRDLGD